jgi:hypothetical protein
MELECAVFISSLTLRLVLFLIASGALFIVLSGLTAHVPLKPLGHGADAAPIDVMHLDTGDLLVFRGRSPGARPIRGWSRSAWTHVGLIFKDENSDLFIYHADPPNSCFDALTGETDKEGVQLNPLHAYLQRYSGECYARELRSQRPSAEAFRKMMRELGSGPFSPGLVRMVRSTFGRTWMAPVLWHSTKPSKGGRAYFCSELTAKALKVLRMIENTCDEREIHPRCFASDDVWSSKDGKIKGRARFSLPWTPGCEYWPVMRLVASQNDRVTSYKV